LLREAWAYKGDQMNSQVLHEGLKISDPTELENYK